jgi:hypothetical protein
MSIGSTAFIDDQSILLSNDDTVKPLNEGKKYRLNHLLMENSDVFTVSTSSQDDLEHIKHIDIKHPGRPHHPTQEDFENRLER